MSTRYAFPRPALAVDIVVFGFDGRDMKIMLIRRSDAVPADNRRALPGGFVRLGESLEEAAFRELEEETGIRKVFLEQLYTFGEPDRDPREHVVSVAYFGLVPQAGHAVKASADAVAAEWFSLRGLPPLCFDHATIVKVARQRLQTRIRYAPIGFELLPRKFTLGQLQQLYEAILEQPLDKRNFRKKVLALDLLQALDEFQQKVAHRAARLYRFDKTRYRQLCKTGFHFEL